MLSVGELSRLIIPGAYPGPMAILSMYVSGALSILPLGEKAITARALAIFFAVNVVPSRGSRAISIFGPSPVPTFSPINSIGASSRSPSPITISPSISILFNSLRIASTAALSAAFSFPRPIQ